MASTKRPHEASAGGSNGPQPLKPRLSPNSFAAAASHAAAGCPPTTAAGCPPTAAPGLKMVEQLQAQLAELRSTLRSTCALDGGDPVSVALDALAADVTAYIEALWTLPAWRRVQGWFDSAHAIVARELGGHTPRSGGQKVEAAIHENFDALKGMAEGDWVADLTAKLSGEWATAARGSDSLASENIKAFHERVLEAKRNGTAERSLELLLPVLEDLDVARMCNAKREERVSLIFQSMVGAVWSEVTTNWLPETLPIADQESFRGLWLSEFKPPAGLTPELLWSAAEEQSAAAGLAARTSPGGAAAAAARHLEVCGYEMPSAIRLAVPGMRARLRGAYVSSGGLNAFLGPTEIDIDLQVQGDLEILLRLHPYRKRAGAADGSGGTVGMRVEVAAVNGSLSHQGTTSLRSGVVGTLQNLTLSAVSRVMYPYLEQWGAEVGLKFSRQMINDWLNTPLAPMLLNAHGLLSVTGATDQEEEEEDDDEEFEDAAEAEEVAASPQPKRRRAKDS